MHKLAYVYDQHILTAGEVAATHVSKWWTPCAPFVQTITSGAPALQTPGQEWWLFQAQVAVASVTGYGRQGHQMKLLTLGPPGHGGIHLQPHQQNNGMAVWTGMCPTQYGFGWALWTGGRLVAGDVVQFNACYVVRRGP
jgi:hypothetical protein